jgi:hypothetical protein
MPTLLEGLRANLGASEAFDRLEQWLLTFRAQEKARLESLRSRSVEAKAPSLEGYIKLNFSRLQVVEQPEPPEDIMTNLKQSILPYLHVFPPSRGYEPLLIESGYHPYVARVIAGLLARMGRRIAMESKLHRRVVEAIRFLGKGKRQRRAIAPRANDLLEAFKKTSIIETIFDNAGLCELEFIRLLKSVVDGQEVDCQRLTQIAATLLPYLSVARGRKVSAASATHELLLEHTKNKISTERRPYSRQKRTDEWVDRLTEATRCEFNEPSFDSRPARRRRKRQAPVEFIG